MVEIAEEGENMKGVYRKKVKDRMFVASLLIIPLLHFVIFWAYVNFSSIALAFQTSTGSFTLANFSLFFQELALPDSVVGSAIVNTLKYFALNLLGIIPLSMIFSFFLYKKILFYKYYRVVFFLPSIISAVILTSLYSYLIAPTGFFGKIWTALSGAEKTPIFLADSRYATNAILLYCLWTGFGVNLILFNGAMSRIPAEVIESAKLDGVGFFREFVYFVIPLIWSTISTVLTLAVVGIFTSSGPILLFTQGNFDTFTLGYWIYDKVASYNSNFQYASAVGLVFTVLGMPIALGARWFLNRFGNGVEY